MSSANNISHETKNSTPLSDQKTEETLSRFEPDRLQTSFITSSIRVTPRSVPVDLSCYDTSVEELALFLRNNKCLSIIGATIQSELSEGSLAPLRDYMSRLKKLTILGYKELDLSALEGCIALKKCKIWNISNPVKYLTKCNRLKTLSVKGDSNINLNLPNLEKLEINHPDNIDIDVSGCSNLTSLTIKLKGNVNDLKLNPGLKKLRLLDVEVSDYSFLKRVPILESLTIDQYEGEVLDLNWLSDLKSLSNLVLSVDGVEGDFSSLTRLEHLKLSYKTMEAIPELPWRLRWLELTRGGFSSTSSTQHLDMGNLSECINLETMFLTLMETDLDLCDISRCTSLKNLSIICEVTRYTACIESLVNLVNLSLRIERLDYYPCLEKCPLLDSLYITDELLEDLSFIYRCNKLTTLYVRSELLHFDSLPSCPKLINIKLDRSPLNSCDFDSDDDEETLMEEGRVVSFLEKVNS